LLAGAIRIVIPAQPQPTEPMRFPMTPKTYPEDFLTDAANLDDLGADLSVLDIEEVPMLTKQERKEINKGTVKGDFEFEDIDLITPYDTGDW
jgi:hypothetical protein